ncbi:MAG: inositol monophosphatase family protein [Bacteroidia bacterium]|nr:inositol monophosphatase family protein [Bacteroidia bacterium]
MEQLDIPQTDAALRELLKKTGRFIVEEFHRFSFDRVEYKGKNDPFTYVDVTSEKLLKDGCRHLIPGSGFVNEETDNEASENGYTWIIDPVDGTSNFTHGVPYFCISLALQKEDEVILGYVYEPLYENLFHAQKGNGAWLNGKRISVSNKHNLQNGLIATGFPYENFPWRNHYLEIVREIMDGAHGIRRMGSAALDLAYVACGRFEGFFELNLKPWDVAAGALLVIEAGGEVTDFSGGKEYLYGRQIVATNGHIHPQMIGIIQSKYQFFPAI